MSRLPTALPGVNLQVVPTIAPHNEKQEFIGLAVDPTKYHTREYPSAGNTPMSDSGPPSNSGVASPLISDRPCRNLVGEARIEGVLSYKPWTQSRESYLAGGSDYFTITVMRTVTQPAVADGQLSALWQYMLSPGSTVVLRALDGEETEIGNKLLRCLQRQQRAMKQASGNHPESGNHDFPTTTVRVSMREESIDASGDGVQLLDAPSHVRIFVVKQIYE